MKTVFQDVSHFEGWNKFPALIEEFVQQHATQRVCEVGAGANPALTPEFIHEHGLLYRAVDENSSELGKSGRMETSAFDICGEDRVLPGAPYDLIVSRMTAEHFRDPLHAYSNMFRSLAPGGFCVHSFACLGSLPFLVNRVVPSWLSGTLLDLFAPRNREQHDKFKAYYRRCRGPVPSQITFFQSLGYEAVEYRGYFGHTYYLRRLSLLHWLHERKTLLLLKKKTARFTSYATVILQRPAQTLSSRQPLAQRAAT